MRDLHFANGVQGWAAGDKGAGYPVQTFILRTTDGATWNELVHPTHSNAWLHAVYFADPVHGWAVGVDDEGNHAIIYHTNNGGENWTEQKCPP